eukprot:Skav223816  [mRNA]  locus=scaffold575:975270:987902:+ [translate_table: standard]
MSKVVLFAQDDHAAAECLAPLTSNYRVLGVGHGAQTSIFARRCVDLGFAFANALEEDVVSGAIEKFHPDVMVLVPDLTGSLPEAFAKSTASRNYVVKVGSTMRGAPWPEFAPIWLKQDSRVGAEVVPVGKEETALSLRDLDAQLVVAGGTCCFSPPVGDRQLMGVRSLRSAAKCCTVQFLMRLVKQAASSNRIRRASGPARFFEAKLWRLQD